MMKRIVRGNPPYSGKSELLWGLATLEEFVGAGILVAEGVVPPLPEGWPLIEWVRHHVSGKTLEHAVERGRKMPPGERGQHLRKAIDGECDDGPRTKGGA